MSLWDVRNENDPCISPGDKVIISGTLAPRNKDTPEDMLLCAECTNATIMAHGPPPEPEDITPADMDRDDLLLHLVRIRGILLDVRIDEIDPRYTTFAIDCKDRIVYAASYTSTVKDTNEDLKRLIGATVSVEGFLSYNSGSRIHRNRIILIKKAGAVHVLEPPSDEVYNAPEIGKTEGLSPEAILDLGRRRAVGRVLAVWNGDTLLLRTAAGETMKITLMTPPPAVGEHIEAVGYTETDLFQINLTSAIWRKTRAVWIPSENATDISADDLFLDRRKNRKINSLLHGNTVRIVGIVRDPAADRSMRQGFTLKSGGYSVPVDCSTILSAIDNLESGSRVSVTGVCIIETETWNRHSTLPRTRGLFISVRSPEDVAVLETPPWWTPARLTTVISVLSFFLIAILIWNASLRTLSERRGRELFRSQIVRAESELRIDERTRLAAELHDHLAQNLTAIAYQLASAERSRASAPEASSGHLATALRMLGSCRTELRRCLWDLRSDALDEPDISLAIRKSIAPVMGSAEVEVTFPIMRTKLSDSTVHAILSIARELAANSVNHGKATRIRVEGDISDGLLRFSVTDDGLGFDPSSAPGSADGHFGLDGVRDRLKKHGGSASVESAPGKGCRVTVVFTSGKADDE